MTDGCVEGFESQRLLLTFSDSSGSTNDGVLVQSISSVENALLFFPSLVLIVLPLPPITSTCTILQYIHLACRRRARCAPTCSGGWARAARACGSRSSTGAWPRVASTRSGASASASASTSVQSFHSTTVCGSNFVSTDKVTTTTYD